MRAYNFTRLDTKLVEKSSGNMLTRFRLEGTDFTQLYIVLKNYVYHLN